MDALPGWLMKTGLAAEVPMPTRAGSAGAYIQMVKRFPILSLEEEQAYARRLRETSDLEAASALVLSHLRLVVSVARGYLGYGLPQTDLIQEGNIGLMKAVKRFDPDRGVRLASYAIHWIKAEMHEFILRNWRLVKIATTKAQRKLFFNLRSMKPGLGALSSEDIGRVATFLKVKPQEVVEMEVRLTGQDIAFEAEDDEDVFAPAQYLTDQQDGPSDVLEREETNHLRTSALKKALASLDSRSRRIIESRWLREENAATLHDLADELKVSAERIRQIESKALLTMRKAMDGQPEFRDP